MGSRAGLQVRVLIQGSLGPAWSEAFSGLTVEPSEASSLIRGEVPDQAALHGLLAAIRDLGIPLISVETDAIRVRESRTGGR